MTVAVKIIVERRKKRKRRKNRVQLQMDPAVMIDIGIRMLLPHVHLRVPILIRTMVPPIHRIGMTIH